MGIAIRTEDLRKVYSSPPPIAAQGMGFMFSGTRGGKKEKASRQFLALDGISLAVQPGEVFGLLGPNGAGKSTTVGILTTRVTPTGGRAWVGEHDVARDTVAVKRQIGVVPQRPNLDFALTAREILTFHGAYFGLPVTERAQRADALLEQFQLADKASQLVRGLSGGMMQRLSIARALMHDPEVLFLDEPSAGLDPQTRLLLWELIREYNRRGKTLLLTTHNMEEADALCGRIAIIDHGRILACDSPAALKSSIPGGWVIHLRLNRATSNLADELGKLPGVREVRAAGEAGLDVYADRGGSLIPAMVQQVNAAGAELHDVHLSEPSLENLFLHYTGRSLRQ